MNAKEFLIENGRDLLCQMEDENKDKYLIELMEDYASNRLEKLVSPKIADLTTGQKIDAILNWQTDEKVHPLVCGCSATNNDEKKFEIVGKRLNGKLFIECTRCGVVQDWIPDCVYQFYIDSNQAEHIVTKSEQTLCNECGKRIRSRDGHIEPLCECASGAVADIEFIIDNLPENRCLYKDSGLWRITDEEFKKTLYEQEVNETFIEFINRVFKNENQLQEL